MQTSPVTLRSNRIYILPSRSGITFALMLLVMLLGSMNYNNSMGLGLSFLLGSIMLVAMHHCHRNLLDLHISYQAPEPVFAGQDASVRVTLHNPNQHGRSDLVVCIDANTAPAVNLPSRDHRAMELSSATRKRGYCKIPRLSVRTRYPAGLFRSWTWVYWDLEVLVYPQPAGTQPLPGKGSGTDSGSNSRTQGNDEMAELRDYQRGDPLNRVAWKHFARSGELHSKTFDEPASVDLWLDWRAVESTDVEERLSQLAAWIVEAHSLQVSYGLRLPTVTINPNLSPAHRAAVYANWRFINDLDDDTWGTPCRQTRGRGFERQTLDVTTPEASKASRPAAIRAKDRCAETQLDAGLSGAECPALHCAFTSVASGSVARFVRLAMAAEATKRKNSTCSHSLRIDADHGRRRVLHVWYV